MPPALISFGNVWRATEARCVHVPTYPWQRQRLWAPRKDWLSASANGNRATSETPEETVAREIRRRAELTAPFVAPRSKLEAVLAESWSTVLGFDRVGVHDNFLELGGDSLQATILLNRLQEHLGQAVPAHMLFHVQTIGDLADYLRREFPSAVRRCHPEEQVDGESHAAAASASIPRLARATGRGATACAIGRSLGRRSRGPLEPTGCRERGAA